MAEAAAKQSDSMEDILQSIKRIIEDDSVGEPKADAAPESAPAASADVLDLTQVIKDDGSVASLPPLPIKTAPEPVAAPVVAPAAFMPEAPKPAPRAAARPAPKPQNLEEGLVSDYATQAAIAALRPITEGGHKDYSIPHIPSTTLRNGNTVEDLVLEALKPMLKAWLDEHLPLIVQKIVEKEVKRIVTFHQD